jgi:hypothetical protein
MGFSILGMSSAAAALATLALASAVLLGCGDDGGPAPGDQAPGGADPEAARVIDEWSQTLSEGDVEGAADYWEIPSVAQNGTPPLELDSRADVIAFNRALPCGAELVDAQGHFGVTIATFELSERPGPGECGAGVGATARTAFVIEDGKITEWRRVDDEPVVEPSGDNPIV